MPVSSSVGSCAAGLAGEPSEWSQQEKCPCRAITMCVGGCWHYLLPGRTYKLEGAEGFGGEGFPCACFRLKLSPRTIELGANNIDGLGQATRMLSIPRENWTRSRLMRCRAGRRINEVAGRKRLLRAWRAMDAVDQAPAPARSVNSREAMQYCTKRLRSTRSIIVKARAHLSQR